MAIEIDKEQRERDLLPERIETLEAELERHQQQLADPQDYAEQAGRIDHPLAHADVWLVGIGVDWDTVYRTGTAYRIGFTWCRTPFSHRRPR